MSRILLVDDEPGVLFTLEEVVREGGHDPVAVGSAMEALDQLDSVDAVVTDLSMPGMDGLELLAQVRARRPRVPVILLTARGTEKSAVRAMKEGAYDYLTKPFDIDELGLVLARALDLVALRRSERRRTAEVDLGHRVVAEHATMQRLLETVARVADRDVPVLVVGETGTGKEIVANLLHAQSKRRKGPLVRFNSAAIPEALAEAELFGHARGAFTGAGEAKRGFFARADGGTLVLDEVGELALGLQAKFLRAVQTGELQPLGTGKVEHSDVRIVASTHRDLEADVRAGRFRQDLYYRLAVIVLRVPPLRERASDIPALARELATHHARRFGLDRATLSSDLLDELSKRSWPGNVRELENAVARMVALSEDGEIGLESLSLLDDAGSPAASASGSFNARLQALERELLSGALDASRGNQSEAARSLGLSRPTFIARAKRLGLI